MQRGGGQCVGGRGGEKGEREEGHFWNTFDHKDKFLGKKKSVDSMKLCNVKEQKKIKVKPD